MSDYSFIANAHPNYIAELYDQYNQNPLAVEESWRTFFKGFDFAKNSNGHSTTGSNPKELQVLSLIKAYRDRGHLLSTTNPIRPRRDRKPQLSPEDYGLTEQDLKTRFEAGKEIGKHNATLQEIIDSLRNIYGGNIGFEYHQIKNRERRRWLRTKIESISSSIQYGIPLEKKKRILEKLNGAVVFEKFLHTKYVGQKRFSLEGGETAIVSLDGIINKAGEKGVEEVVIGMAHRGRLNVLANIMGKTYQQIFSEFEGTAVPDLSFGDGDVKYHLGFSSQVNTPEGNPMNLKLVPNPSHLESVNPVVEGFSRAKADILYESNFNKILPILIHGDAAVAGQGIVYETLQMSQLKGYYTGGTIHLVINNQIGFTTDFDDARSSVYCTGLASAVDAPVFHVNGDDPEAVLFVSELALEYRQEFNTDVFIDLVCYRRHGHNEGDDPKFTQPQMYDIINNHPNPREIYINRLSERGDLEKKLGDELEKKFWDDLQMRLDEIRQNVLPYEYQAPELAWRKLKKTTDPKDFETSPTTGIDKKTFDGLVKHLMTLPEGFSPLTKVNRLMKANEKMLQDKKLDWAFGELLAYGSLLLEKHDIRISGQDVKRGTFSHRHAVVFDGNSFTEYNRLATISKDQGQFRIYNSLLSEFGVMGFEYGYSLASPDSLVIWEAQFGDFYNGAQTIVDQYISAAESKWQRMSGLVLLLPHGYEGQGPEHSSARLERFLQSCSEYNMTVANVTNPANFFHLLRRQLARPFRKPLVVMSPKSLLRHPECVAGPDEFTGNTSFQEIYDDTLFKDSKSGSNARKLLLCTGKIYFDLLDYQKTKEVKDVAIVRIEQLYPLPVKKLKEIFAKYANATITWVQEEPSNMGGWQYIQSMIMSEEHQFGVSINHISRKSSASPATGYKKVHDKQQEEIVMKSFA